MIRPVTLITAGLAVLSGLYLYHAKNTVMLLDRTIERTARDTIAIGEHTRLLHAEWTLLNDPERLRHFADLHLSLKPLAPTQFTSMSDLAGRLPAPLAPRPEPPPTPVTIETNVSPTRPQSTEEPAPASNPQFVADESLPIPPIPVPPPMQAPRPSAPVQLAGFPRPVDTKPVDTKPVEPRSVETRATEARPAAMRPPLQAMPTAGASALGTSGSASASPLRPALPAPVPVTPTAVVARSPAPPAAGPYGLPARNQPPTYHPTPVGGSMLGGAQRAAPMPLPTPYYAPIHDGGG